MNEKQHEALKLANKMYLNSYECMWNDAMIHSHKNNMFYFYDNKIYEELLKRSKRKLEIIMHNDKIWSMLVNEIKNNK